MAKELQKSTMPTSPPFHHVVKESDEVPSEILSASTVEELLPPLADGVWRLDFDNGTHCGDPDSAPIPTELDIVDWLAHCPQDALNESLNRFAEAAQCEANVKWRWLPELMHDENDTKREWGRVRRMVPGEEREDEIVPQAQWLRHANAWRALIPLIRTWQQAQGLKIVPFAPVRRAALPQIGKFTAEEAREASSNPMPWREDSSRQLSLPELPDAPEGYPSWLLRAFESLVGDINGRPTFELRLFVAALLRVPHGERDGRWRTMAFPVLDRHRERYNSKESIESMMFEDGWTNWKRDWQKLIMALDSLNRSPARLMVKPELNTAFVFFQVTAFPQAEDGVVEISIRIPQSSANGDRLDWPSLRRYGVKSRARYCAYLSATALLGRTANNGHPQTAEIGRVLVGTYIQDDPRLSRSLRQATSLTGRPGR